MKSIKKFIIRKFIKADNYLDEHPGFGLVVNMIAAAVSVSCVIFISLLLLSGS